MKKPESKDVLIPAIRVTKSQKNKLQKIADIQAEGNMSLLVRRIIGEWLSKKK